MSTKAPFNGLALTVRPGEIIYIGNTIKIHAENNGTGRVRVMINCPKDIYIGRDGSPDFPPPKEIVNE